MQKIVEKTKKSRKITDFKLSGEMHEGFDKILTSEALEFVAELGRAFNPRRLALLQKRQEIQTQIDQGHLPDFLVETQKIRGGQWTIAPVPHDLQDRRVEITGPVNRKMVINAMNSGAKVFMADIEDSHSPGWKATVEGQINLYDLVRETIEYTNPAGKHYSLNSETATLMVRPRGWHLDERHMLIDGESVSASLFDFGLFFFHNAQMLLDKGSGPYFYLPKLENHHEAQLWNDVFVLAQQLLDIPNGTIKATVLIETILAAFEMDEILYALKDHSAGLNCGRWDYIFSCIKKFCQYPDTMMPDRAQVTMTTHAMRSYSLLAIQTCHKRGAHAMGGMSAQIPIKNDRQANDQAISKVREDKQREATDGHDGTWVAHPGLIPVAMEVFNQKMPMANQIHRPLENIKITAADLLTVPEGTITEQGLRTNISVGLQYLEAWLSGNGCVPINHLMEDAATAEISRSQLWQWVHHRAKITESGQKITLELVREIMNEELENIRREWGDEKYQASRFILAAKLFDEMVSSETFEPFLTIPAYPYLD